MFGEVVGMTDVLDSATIWTNERRAVLVDMDLNLLRISVGFDVLGGFMQHSILGISVDLATNDTPHRTTLRADVLAIIRGRASDITQGYTELAVTSLADCIANIESRKQRVAIQST